MFFLKKIIAAFLKPPGVFVFSAIALAVVLAVRRKWRQALVAAVVAVALWLPAIGPVSDLMRQGLISNIPGAGDPLAGDVIVVLGGGADDRVRDPFGAVGVVSESMARRIVTAVQLYGRLGAPIIVTGGVPLGERITEADVAARYLVDLGVPRDAIITEGRARDTGENARFVSDICREKGFGRVLLVSSSDHLKRAVMAFGPTGLAIRPVGDTGLEAVAREYRWSDFLPSSYDATARYLHEYLGILAYRLTG
ncbi:MAG: YdcF family protein [Pseudomonadota bacterium]